MVVYRRWGTSPPLQRTDRRCKMEYKGVKYNKYFESLTDNVRAVLASGRFPFDNAAKWEAFNSDLKCDRVLAVIEFPTIDIELEMWTHDGYDYFDADWNDCQIRLCYVVCIKVDDDDVTGWETYDYAPYLGRVDFASPTWEDDLTRDMCQTLEQFAEYHGFSFTELNN